MTANEFQEGRELRPNFSFVQADQPAARLLPCRGDTFCRGPSPDRPAGEGMDCEAMNGAFALLPPSREPTAMGKSCLATEACDNSTEHPATISVRAFHQHGAGRRTARSGGMHISGSGRHHGFGRHEDPGSAREWHRVKASDDDWALRHLPVFDDGCLGAPAGSGRDSVLRSRGVAARSHDG